MADPLSLAVVGGVALTEGIKFLYGQVSKILERRAARIEADAKQAELKKSEPANIQLPDTFQGQLSSPEIDFDEVERQYKSLLSLRGKLVNYADGTLKADPKDSDLISDVDVLRQVLESIYKQRITFKGENREQSGTRVTSKVKVGQVAGKFVVVRIGDARNVDVHSEVEIDNITETSDTVLTDIGSIHNSAG